MLGKQQRSGQRLVIVDDDALCRELLELMAAQAGFEATSFPSGDAAVAGLRGSGAEAPDAVLVDLHMPGTTGGALAEMLRMSCGRETRLLAMSGSALPAGLWPHFDGFLRKPFGVEELCAAVFTGQGSVPVTVMDEVALSPSIFASLRASMPEGQLAKLYTMCLDDAEKRMEQMRQASRAGDRASFVGAAHAIKGGCGMVGAVELAALAAAMEENGPPPPDEAEIFTQFLGASSRLRGMLDRILNEHQSNRLGQI